MRHSPLLESCQAAAIDYVAGRSSGGPLDAQLRITLNFHPDRLHEGVPILQARGQV